MQLDAPTKHPDGSQQGEGQPPRRPRSWARRATVVAAAMAVIAPLDSSFVGVFGDGTVPVAVAPAPPVVPSSSIPALCCLSSSTTERAVTTTPPTMAGAAAGRVDFAAAPLLTPTSVAAITHAPPVTGTRALPPVSIAVASETPAPATPAERLAAAQGYFPNSGLGQPYRLRTMESYAGVTAPARYATGYLDTTSANIAHSDVWGYFVDGSNPGATNARSDSYAGYPSPAPAIVVATPLAFGSQHPSRATAASELQTTISGGNDSLYSYLAHQMAASGYAGSIVRLGWEYNGDWYPWSALGNESLYIKAFQHAVGVIRAADPWARIDWNGNGCGATDFAAYPGDQYVDIVGADIYDSGGTKFGACARPYEQFAVAHGKSVAYDEWGFFNSAGDDPGFVQSAHDWMAGLPATGAGALLDDSLFDSASNSGTEEIQNLPHSLAAFNTLFGQ